jgi:hypothetical protein
LALLIASFFSSSFALSIASCLSNLALSSSCASLCAALSSSSAFSLAALSSASSLAFWAICASLANLSCSINLACKISFSRAWINFILEYVKSF